MPRTAVNGTVLCYEEFGDGPPLLLLHGGLGTASLHWWRDIPFYAGSFRVIAPDMRGYGRSSPPRDYPPNFYERDADDMAALLRALDTRPAHVLGWSDGAVVGLVLAARHPDALRSLTCIAGEAHILPSERDGWPALIDTAAWSERATERFRAAQGPENWPDILTRMLDGYNGVFDAAGGEVVRRQLGEIHCPVLLLHGEADDVVPVSHAHELQAELPDARLHIYPGTGHLPHREHEADVRARVLAFITDVEARPSNARNAQTAT